MTDLSGVWSSNFDGLKVCRLCSIGQSNPVWRWVTSVKVGPYQEQPWPWIFCPLRLWELVVALIYKIFWFYILIFCHCRWKRISWNLYLTNFVPEGNYLWSAIDIVKCWINCWLYWTSPYGWRRCSGWFGGRLGGGHQQVVSQRPLKSYCRSTNMSCLPCPTNLSQIVYLLETIAILARSVRPLGEFYFPYFHPLLSSQAKVLAWCCPSGEHIVAPSVKFLD